MPGPLDFMEQAPLPERVRGAPVPVDNFEVIAASFRLAVDDQAKEQRVRLDDAYEGLVTEIQRRRGKASPSEFRTAISLAPNYDEYSRKYDGGAVWRAIEADRAAAREAGKPDPWPDLPKSAKEFELGALRRQGGRDADQATVSRASGVLGTAASLIGGIGGDMTDPVNVAFLPLGGPGKTAARRIIAEGLINLGVEAVQTPARIESREALGEPMTAGDVAQNLVFALVGGSSIQAGGEVLAFLGKKGLARLRPIEKRIAEEIQRSPGENPVAVAADVLALEDPELAVRVLAQRNGDLSPEEKGALAELQRAAELDAANPYAPIGDGRVQFEDELTRSLDAIIASAQAEPAAFPAPLPARAAPEASVPVREPGMGTEVNGRVLARFDMDRYLGRNRTAESGGNDAADAISSSAFGRYQFLKDTWLSFYRKTFGNTGESNAQILAKRANGEVQDAVMRTFTEDNLSRLERAGVQLTEGNAYLAHFLGIGDAIRVLRAAPDTPVGQVVDAASITANRDVFKKISSASELIAWAHRKMGGGAASVPVGGGRVSAQGEVSQGAVLREEAARLEREAADIQGLGPIQFDRFDPDQITVNAQLMQFKGGGDEFGVTERLRDVKQWNPFFAGRVMVWETLDGQFIIADGHQRVGLAKRIKAQGDGQQPMLDAFILRETDGWDAETVRTWAALKNIAEGTGSAVDAAKVLRGVPREVWSQFLPPRSALVRDAEGIVRLGDDAFGMVVNELVDPSHAGLVGRMANDPGEQKALMDLLVKLSPRTLGEADGVIRQGMAAGFARETQEDMFGTLDVASSLFIERARVLDRGLAELRKMRQAFGSAARNADTLEAAGNTINREASAREVEDNARAVEIVRRSAWSAGPVKDALDAGAARLAAGDRPADVIRDFVAAVRGLNLDDLARLVGSGEGASRGGGADGAGRGGESVAPDAGLRPVDGDPPEPQLTPQGDPVDPVDGAWPSREELEAAGQDAFDLGPASPVQQFDEPAGVGQKAQLESVEHDLRQVADREQAAVDQAASRAKLIEDAPEALKLEVDRIRTAAEPKQQALVALGAELGDTAEFINPGIKGRDRMIEKVVRENYGSAAELKDVVRGAFIVDALDGGETVARMLLERFPGSTDKGWKRLPDSGYFDRKLILDIGDGMKAEIQILPRAVWKVKKAEGNRIYQQARSTDDVALQQQLNARARELYDQALAGSDFAPIAFGSASGNAAPNASGESLSPSNSALVNSAGVSRQDPSLNTQAAPDARSMATGRSSTSNSSNVMEAPLFDNSADPANLQVDPGLTDRQRQAVQLGAEAPLRGANRTGQAQDGTMGLGLFDAADQQSLFEVDGAPRTIGDILGEADGNRAAIAAARACLL